MSIVVSSTGRWLCNQTLRKIAQPLTWQGHRPKGLFVTQTSQVALSSYP